MKKIIIEAAQICEVAEDDDYADYYDIEVRIGNQKIECQPYKIGLKYIPIRLYIFMVLLSDSFGGDPFGLIETERKFINRCERYEN